MATLTDVAKKANVSKMTVSRVINHPEQVTDELKQLVYKAMKELNYVPNYAARALVNNRTQVIKLLILEEMDTVEPYYMNLLTGISRELDKNHYSLQLVTRTSLNIGKCDGIIVTGMREKDYAFIDQIDIPVVLFGENIHGYDFVDVDNKKGTYLSTRHLLDIGYKQLIFIGIDEEEPFEKLREIGYLEAMTEERLEGKAIKTKNSSREAEKKVLEFLKSEDGRFGFVCASDRIAMGVIRAIQQLGKKVPEDFVVTGFDGVFLDRISSPKITTIRQPVMEMGEACARVLLKKVDESNKKQGKHIFEPKLIIRESSVLEEL
ncbi:LacI family DNA-binding transcriptional regulator [Bacillus sp. B1-b2]|uniref:LacI family DNA-binding transcriptional regulator n=1 Tax=Bacillus sp. B1-b2 TaxID=2653201 RepID=UPI0012629A93|nr:LacI family DNA-binding transcriptional regulator [Bacillus sp. B1-b2]KAB7670678.1 LacI family transcriptional regulator [Bacillus sp. B1-b2]